MSPISAIVTAYQRLDQTLTTLHKLYECQPRPTEILVHVDGNKATCAAAILAAFPDVKVLLSEGNVGPGGGRNKLIEAARHELVASFDDDSYPLDLDYFARVSTLMENWPEASILSAFLYHLGEPIMTDVGQAEWVSDFAGGSCVYRRSAFLATTGYVPLPLAYGMEEVDLALRLHAQGGLVLRSRWLRVFHDTDLARHASPRVTAASITNTCLLVHLRYQPWLWPIGAVQCLNRVLWLLRHGRWAGIMSGLFGTPLALMRNHHYRAWLPTSAVLSYLRLRRSPLAAEPQPDDTTT
jgi:GT2 family glycosyltransferase